MVGHQNGYCWTPKPGGFGFQGPEVRFSRYAPVTYWQTNNGAELWVAPEVLHCFGFLSWHYSQTSNTYSRALAEGRCIGASGDGHRPKGPSWVG